MKPTSPESLPHRGVAGGAASRPEALRSSSTTSLAVVRIIVRTEPELSESEYVDGLADLGAAGLQVIAPAAGHRGAAEFEAEVITELGPATTERLVARCAEAFGRPAELGVVTFISRGTDGDAEGVLARFGLDGTVTRFEEDGEEVVTVRVPADQSRRVPESRLHTALEAALNCEVRIAYR